MTAMAMKDHDTTDDILSKTVQMQQTNRCDIIPAATHWVRYFKCSFSISEKLYKLENMKCDI